MLSSVLVDPDCHITKNLLTYDAENALRFVDWKNGMPTLVNPSEPDARRPVWLVHGIWYTPDTGANAASPGLTRSLSPLTQKPQNSKTSLKSQPSELTPPGTG